MSTISDGRLAAQNPGTKVSSTQCTNAMNNELGNETKQQRKQITCMYCILAILVGIIAVLLIAFSGLPSNTYVSPKDCFATGRGLEMAMVGKQAKAVMHTVDTSGKGYNTQMETVACELVSEPNKKKVDCKVRKVMENQFEISYQATSRGRHQLHIKVEGEHIKGSPFTVTIIRQLGGPKGTIKGQFKSITLESLGQKIIAGELGSISVFDSSLNKLKSFGSFGSDPGEFHEPCDLAVDSGGILLVADCTYNRIHKFNRWAHKHITQIGKTGNGNLEFNHPSGLAIHPKNGMVYIADTNNNRIQVLHQNLTFHKIFGLSDDLPIIEPKGIVFDSTGNIYVANNRYMINIFTAEGKFLRQFGTVGEGEGEIKHPSAITIDSNDIVYVCESTNQRISLFTTEGKFLTSLDGKKVPLNERIYPKGVAVDNKGIIYVIDKYIAIKAF